MAGSYRHVTDSEGKFSGMDAIDNLGDAHEALEECVEMIYYLTGGSRKLIYEAHLEGHLRGVNSARVDEEKMDPRKFFRRYWSEYGDEEEAFPDEPVPTPEPEPMPEEGTAGQAFWEATRIKARKEGWDQAVKALEAHNFPGGAKFLRESEHVEVGGLTPPDCPPPPEDEPCDWVFVYEKHYDGETYSCEVHNRTREGAESLARGRVSAGWGNRVTAYRVTEKVAYEAVPTRVED